MLGTWQHTLSVLFNATAKAGMALQHPHESMDLVEPLHTRIAQTEYHGVWQLLPQPVITVLTAGM